MVRINGTFLKDSVERIMYCSSHLDLSRVIGFFFKIIKLAYNSANLWLTQIKHHAEHAKFHNDQSFTMQVINC